MKIKNILFICLILSLFTLGTKQAYAASFDEIKEKASMSLTKVWEQVELVFTFNQENKVTLLTKHAQRRLDWAQEEFDLENSELGQKYLDEYVNIKGKIVDRLTEVGDVALEEYKDKTVSENNQIEEIKGKVGESEQNVIEENQLQVLGATWEVVTDIQGTTEAENFVNIIYAPGTGAGGVSKLVIEGGELQYAPGTSAGGTSGVVIEGGRAVETVENVVE